MNFAQSAVLRTGPGEEYGYSCVTLYPPPAECYRVGTPNALGVRAFSIDALAALG